MQMPSMQMPPMQMPHAPPPPPPPQMPQVNMGPLAAPKMPDKAPATGSGPNMLLIVIFCLVAFLVGALLMVLLLKPKDAPKPHAGVQTQQVAGRTDHPI
jgi:hypothetical protein